MDEREAQRTGYPLTIPDALLRSEAMQRACAARDFQEIFRLVNRRTGSSQAVMATAIGKMTSSRVSDIIRGVRGIRGREVIERVADGFGIPGEMLGLPKRPWEGSPGSIDGTSDVRNSVGAMCGEMVSVDRRAFVSATTAALTEIPAAAMKFDRDQRVVQALDVMSNDSPGVIADSLSELIDHYALTICAFPPAHVYDELFMVRSYANRILNSAGVVRRRKDMTLATGWLSCLLGIAACDMGAHAAAHVWCADAERRSQEARHPELAGWALLTRSMIAFYQGQPRQSVALASRGQNATSMGAVVHAKLAAQEMRAAAMASDAGGMERARRYAAKAAAKLPSGVKTAGAFSIALAEDPPYTATSLMLLGRFQEAVSATNRVIQTVYQPEARQRGEHPSGYARALLILGLAQAGTGDLDEAVSAGHAALADNLPAWPTVVLAGKLNQVLERDFADARQSAEYHARYLEVANHLTGHHLPSPKPSKDRK
jgi:tetratricopeptide (TPR) repeat protein